MDSVGRLSDPRAVHFGLIEELLAGFWVRVESMTSHIGCDSDCLEGGWYWLGIAHLYNWMLGGMISQNEASLGRRSNRVLTSLARKFHVAILPC